MLISYLSILFGEVTVKIFGLFLKSGSLFSYCREFKVFFFVCFCYMLDNSSLSDVSFANRFSQSVTCLLILLTLFCTEQQFFILMKSRLSMIAFMDHAFGVVPKKSLPNKRSFRSSPM